MNLGENIYRLRSERNMSQGALADALEVSRQSVSKWENNSAIPELDKLLKMSELFGVTLDALVGKEAPVSPAPEPAAPEVIVRQSMSPRRIIGTILLCFGLLTFLILSILSGLFLGFVCGVPFVIVGIVLLTCTTDLMFKCCWLLFAVYAPVDYLFILNFIGYGVYISMIFVGVWFAILLLWTAVLIRKGKLSASSRKLMIGSVAFALVLGIVLGAVMSLHQKQTGLYTTTQELEVDSSFMD